MRRVGRSDRHASTWCRKRRVSRPTPNPPPPGVSMTNTSPGLHRDRARRAEFLALPSARSTQLRPTAPGPPPATPNGATRRWLASIAAVIGSRKRTRRSRAVAAAMPPAPPLPLPDRERLEPHRKAPFEHLGIGEPRIGHVRLHDARAVEVRTGAGAARDRLVVLVRVVAEREVVHRPLRGRQHAERAVQRVGDRLRRLDVARDDRGRIARREHRPFGNHDPERLQAAGIHRDLVVDQRAEHVEHRGLAHGGRRVEVGRLLRARPGEVDRRRAPRLVDRDRHGDRRAAVHLVLEMAVGQHVEHAAHRLLGVVLHVLHVGANHRQAEMRDHLRAARARPSRTRRPAPAGRRGSGRRCATGSGRRRGSRASRLRGSVRPRRAARCRAARLPRRRASNPAASSPA